jgi:hypothetical protein
VKLAEIKPMKKSKIKHLFLTSKSLLIVAITTGWGIAMRAKKGETYSVRYEISTF